MDREEVREVAHEAAEHAVQEVFLRYGIDAGNPLETQKDFAYLRQQRSAAEAVGPVIKRTVIGLAVTGLLALLVIGFQNWLGGGGPPSP